MLEVGKCRLLLFTRKSFIKTLKKIGNIFVKGYSENLSKVDRKFNIVRIK